jgi:DNA-binding NtrC family response regulator
MDNRTIGSDPTKPGASGLDVLGGLKIVLVDDEPGVLRALTLLLQALKCEVSSFDTPGAALSYLVTKPPVDLVLSDMRMPEFSGAELLRSVRRSELRVPFILMSGHATNEEVSEARALGLQGFISKPFTPAQLADLVALALGRPAEQTTT